MLGHGRSGSCDETISNGPSHPGNSGKHRVSSSHAIGSPVVPDEEEPGPLPKPVDPVGPVDASAEVSALPEDVPAPDVVLLPVEPSPPDDELDGSEKQPEASRETAATCRTNRMRRKAAMSYGMQQSVKGIDSTKDPDASAVSTSDEQSAGFMAISMLATSSASTKVSGSWYEVHSPKAGSYGSASGAPEHAGLS